MTRQPHRLIRRPDLRRHRRRCWQHHRLLRLVLVASAPLQLLQHLPPQAQPERHKLQALTVPLLPPNRAAKAALSPISMLVVLVLAVAAAEEEVLGSAAAAPAASPPRSWLSRQPALPLGPALRLVARLRGEGC